MNNKKRYCSTLKAILQYLKKRNPVSLEGDNKELKKDAFLVPYFLFPREYLKLLKGKRSKPVS